LVRPFRATSLAGMQQVPDARSNRTVNLERHSCLNYVRPTVFLAGVALSTSGQPRGPLTMACSVAWMGWLSRIDPFLVPFPLVVGLAVGRIIWNVFGWSRSPPSTLKGRRPFFVTESTVKNEKSMRCFYIVSACFLSVGGCLCWGYWTGAIALPLATVVTPMVLSVSSTVWLLWRSVAGVPALVVYVIGPLISLYCRAGVTVHCAAILTHEASTAATNALAVLDVVLGQKLSQSAVGSGPPTMLVHASPLVALVGLVFGFAGVALWYGTRQRSLWLVLIGSAASPKDETLEGYRQQLDWNACRLEKSLHVPIPVIPPDFAAALGKECRRRVLAAVNMAWYMVFHVPRLVGVDVSQLRWILGVVLGFAASLHGWNPLVWGCVTAMMGLVLVPDLESLLRMYELARPGVLMVDVYCGLAVMHPGDAFLTLAWPHCSHCRLNRFSRWSHISLFAPSSLSLAAFPSHSRRELRRLWRLGAKRRPWRFYGVWPSVGRSRARVEPPSNGLRAIIQEVDTHLRMVVSKCRKQGRQVAALRRKLDRVATQVYSAQTLADGHQVSVRVVGGDFGDDLLPERALCYTLEQHPRVLIVKATELTKTFQVFVRNIEGKSITINDLTGQTSVPDFKLKVKRKTGMRGVWPIVWYRGKQLDDSKNLSTYGIEQDANLKLIWFLLGGVRRRTPPSARNMRAELSRAATNTSDPLDEDSDVEPGPRSRSASPSITAADRNEDGANVRAAIKPTIAFVDEHAAHQPQAMGSPSLATNPGHALPRSMDECDVESFEDYDEHAMDALSHNVEASSVASDAPVVYDAACNGASALDERQASDIAGVRRLPCAEHARICLHARSKY
jgi:hypothetical protein